MPWLSYRCISARPSSSSAPLDGRSPRLPPSAVASPAPSRAGSTGGGRGSPNCWTVMLSAPSKLKARARGALRWQLSGAMSGAQRPPDDGPPKIRSGENRMHSQLRRHEVTARVAGHGAEAHSGVLTQCMNGVRMKFQNNGSIYGQGERVGHVYEVVRGAVRTVKILPDGRRQIGGFYFAGELFGLDDRNEHSFSAEAMVKSEVFVVKRRSLSNLAQHNGE